MCTIPWELVSCLSFSLLLHAAAAAAKSLQSCPTLCNPIDGSPPGSAIPGILQARTLEWIAIAFSACYMRGVFINSYFRCDSTFLSNTILALMVIITDGVLFFLRLFNTENYFSILFQKLIISCSKIFLHSYNGLYCIILNFCLEISLVKTLF